MHLVRREKVWLFSGCKSHPANSVAPAGSYRSGGGGNEAAGAFEKTSRTSDSASSQAVTRVNVEQASKDLTWKPTRLYIGEGRSRWGNEAHASRSDTNQGFHRGNDDGMRANGEPRQHGKPLRWERVTPKPDAREGHAGSTGVADRPVVPMKPVNAGGGKGPEFKTDVRKSTRTRRLA
jgi:hypothetical protein